MPKTFLSHSSKEKWYVEIVASKLGKDNIVYDAWTFEEGQETLQEILQGLNESDIFIFFISEAALQSSWVKKEVLEAERKLSENDLRKFYPIIIDQSIQHSDNRIPEWVKRNYNVRFIAKPTKAAERVKQQLRIVAWELHPKTRQLSQLFIGRTELIRKFEERIYDFDKIAPISLIASGLPSIGRRKFMTHCLKNANKIKPYYEPPTLLLNNKNSIEDFILGLHDLGYSELDQGILLNLLRKTITEKVDLAVQLVKEVRLHENIIFIVDNYSIVIEDGSIVDWFFSIVKVLEKENQLTFCLISRVRVKLYLYRFHDSIFAIDLHELENYERKALFKSLLDISEIDISSDDFNSLTNLFNGFPEQIIFTFNLIKEEGLQFVLKNTHLIVDYNSEKVSQFVKKYENNELAYSILILIGEFDFISLTFLFEILGSELDAAKPIIEEFSNNFIIEYIGAAKEYVRLNDAIRDFIQRSGLKVPDRYYAKIKEHARNFIESHDESGTEDLSNFIISIGEGLKSGKNIPDQYLVPSHFLRAMKDLYNLEKKFGDVIVLADKILSTKNYLDKRIIKEIRYWLCLALARKRDPRLLQEAKLIDGPDHNYLLGFYYRLTGKFDKAIERFEAVLQTTDSFKAKRELVQVYLNLDDYENAIELAREVYNQDKINPYNLQSYFRCIVKLYGKARKEELNKLLNQLSKINTDAANEMHMTSKARYLAYVENNSLKSIDIINEAISTFPGNFYPLMTKLEICRKYSDWPEIDKTIKKLEAEFRSDHEVFSKLSYLASKSLLLVHKGFEREAQKLLDTRMRNKFPESTIENLETEMKELKKQL